MAIIMSNSSQQYVPDCMTFDFEMLEDKMLLEVTCIFNFSTISYRREQYE